MPTARRKLRRMRELVREGRYASQHRRVADDYRQRYEAAQGRISTLEAEKAELLAGVQHALEQLTKQLVAEQDSAGAWQRLALRRDHTIKDLQEQLLFSRNALADMQHQRDEALKEDRDAKKLRRRLQERRAELSAAHTALCKVAAAVRDNDYVRSRLPRSVLEALRLRTY